MKNIWWRHGHMETCDTLWDKVQIIEVSEEAGGDGIYWVVGQFSKSI